jgi:predicted MFS family arabinose efflux permease
MAGAFRLVLVALAMFATGTDAYVLPGLLPEIARTLGVEFGAAAQIVSAYSLVYAVSIIPLAVATSRWPFRTTFAVGLALFVAGCLGSALTTNLSMMLIGRCCCGLGVAIVAPTCAAAAVALQPANRHGRAISIIMFSMALAMAVGLPAGAFIADAFGWRTTLFLLAPGILAGAKANHQPAIARRGSAVAARPGDSLSRLCRTLLRVHLFRPCFRSRHRRARIDTIVAALALGPGRCRG